MPFDAAADLALGAGESAGGEEGMPDAKSAIAILRAARALGRL